MKDYITRSFTNIRVSASEVSYENGEVKTSELEPIVVEGRERLSTERALHAVRMHYGKKNQYVVTAIEPETKIYRISKEDFFAHAELVADEGAQEEAEKPQAKKTKRK